MKNLFESIKRNLEVNKQIKDGTYCVQASSEFVLCNELKNHKVNAVLDGSKVIVKDYNGSELSLNINNDILCIAHASKEYSCKYNYKKTVECISGKKDFIEFLGAALKEEQQETKTEQPKQEEKKEEVKQEENKEAEQKKTDSKIVEEQTNAEQSVIYAAQQTSDSIYENPNDGLFVKPGFVSKDKEEVQDHQQNDDNVFVEAEMVKEHEEDLKKDVQNGFVNGIKLFEGLGVAGIQATISEDTRTITTVIADYPLTMRFVTDDVLELVYINGISLFVKFDLVKLVEFVASNGSIPFNKLDVVSNPLETKTEQHKHEEKKEEVKQETKQEENKESEKEIKKEEKKSSKKQTKKASKKEQAKKEAEKIKEEAESSYIKLEDNYEEQVNQAQYAYIQQQQQANQAFVTQQFQDIDMNQQMQFSNDQYYNQFGF